MRHLAALCLLAIVACEAPSAEPVAEVFDAEIGGFSFAGEPSLVEWGERSLNAFSPDGSAFVFVSGLPLDLAPGRYDFGRDDGVSARLCLVGAAYDAKATGVSVLVLDGAQGRAFEIQADAEQDRAFLTVLAGDVANDQP